MERARPCQGALVLLCEVQFLSLGLMATACLEWLGYNLLDYLGFKTSCFLQEKFRHILKNVSSIFAQGVLEA